MEEKTPEQMFKEAEDAKRAIVEAHEKKKTEEQEKMIENFKKQLMMSRQPVKRNKKDFKKIFDEARNYCLSVLVECTCMPVEEICRMFSTDDFIIDPYHPSGIVQPKYPNYYWFNDLRGEKNIIPLPNDMEKPKRKDRKTGKLSDMIFTVSRFYTDPEYLAICNDYFNKFNLNFYITNMTRKDGRKSFKWKLELVINKAGFINLRPLVDSLENADIQFVEEFAKAEEVENDEEEEN